jgi:predicted amidohydrolase/ribosomal protein S18 acetylase RimI-like enzyme
MTEWATKAVRDAFFATPKFPRILNVEAVKQAIQNGVANGFFAYVGKSAKGDYSPFVFGKPMMTADVELSEEMFLIKKEAAEEYLKGKSRPPEPEKEGPKEDEKKGGEKKPDDATPKKPEELTATGLTWTGEIPPQKWMNTAPNWTGPRANCWKKRRSTPMRSRACSGWTSRRIDGCAPKQSVLEPAGIAGRDSSMAKTRTPVKVRRATKADIPKLIALNRAAYPVLARENAAWSENHLLSHQRIFPDGQLVAEANGKVVGAAATLIVDMGPDPLRAHTWAGITDSGYFTNHDPGADTLYGADVYVHPDARGMGIGAALYEGRRQLCRRLNKRRILAGGRLWNYHEHSGQMTAAEYAQRVAAGEFRDLVLSFQLREGFQLRGVIPNYLRDPKSHNWASLIEWLNPDYKPGRRGPRKARIACVQYKMRKVKSFAQFAQQVTYFTDVAADYQADFVMFPELFTVQLLSATQTKSPQEGMRKLAEYTPKLERLLQSLAMKYSLTIIGGSHPVPTRKELFNICYVCLPNGQVVEQPKLHITPNERRWWGISGGHSLQVIETPKARIGVTICYDVEFPETARHLADAGVEILFVPFCTDNRQGYLRVRHCAAARAIENQIYVALAGNVGNLPDVMNMDVQYGQAAVLTPSDFAFARDGVAAEAEANEETVLICDVDLDALHGSRSNGTVTPRLDRRADLFRVSSRFADRESRASNSGPDEPLGDQLHLPGENAAEMD